MTEDPKAPHGGMEYLPETMPAIERLELAFDEMDLPPQEPEKSDA